MPMPFFFLEPVFLQPSDRPKINHFNVWKYAAQVVQNYLLINNIYFPKKKIEKLGSKWEKYEKSSISKNTILLIERGGVFY